MTVVNTVVSPIPVVGPPAADAINQGVSDGTNKLTDTVNKVGGVGQAPQNPGAPGNPQTPGGETPGVPGAPAGGPAPGVTIPDANSPVIGGGSAPEFGGLPGNFFTPTGWAAMRDYGGIPVAGAGAFSPSPALRYGNQIPGYAPQFGLLGSDGKKNSGAGIQNAGRAEALPYSGESSWRTRITSAHMRYRHSPESVPGSLKLCHPEMNSSSGGLRPCGRTLSRSPARRSPSPRWL